MASGTQFALPRGGYYQQRPGVFELAVPGGIGYINNNMPATTIAVATQALTLTPKAVTINAKTVISVATQALTLAPKPLTINARSAIAVATQALTLTPEPVSLNASTAIAVATQTLTLTPEPVQLAETVNVASHALTLTPNSVTIDSNVTITVATQALTLAPEPVQLVDTVNVASHTLTLTPNSVTIDSNVTINVATQTLTLTPEPVQLAETVNVATRALTLTPEPVQLVDTINVAPQALTLTPEPITLSTNATINVATQALILTPEPVQLAETVNVATRALTLTPKPITLSTTSVIDVATHALTLTANPVSLNAATTIAVATRALTLTAVPVDINKVTIRPATLPLIYPLLPTSLSQMTLHAPPFANTMKQHFNDGYGFNAPDALLPGIEGYTLVHEALSQMDRDVFWAFFMAHGTWDAWALQIPNDAVDRLWVFSAAPVETYELPNVYRIAVTIEETQLTSELRPEELTGLYVCGIDRDGGTGTDLDPVNHNPYNLVFPYRIDANNWRKVVASKVRTGTLALRTDGNLYSWGLDNAGELGQGTAGVNNRTPTLVFGSGWADIAMADDHTIAIKADGTLWGWGNSPGVHALAADTVSAPYQIGTYNKWHKIACSDAASFAIREDGSLWAWGEWSTNNLGLGVAPFVPSIHHDTYLVSSDPVTLSGDNGDGLPLTGQFVTPLAEETVFTNDSATYTLFYSYVEFVIDQVSSTTKVGVSDGSTALGVSTFGVAWLPDGTVIYNSTPLGTTLPYTTGDIVMMAIDPINRLIWFGVNGTWDGVPATHPSSGTGQFEMFAVHPAFLEGGPDGTTLSGDNGEGGEITVTFDLPPVFATVFVAQSVALDGFVGGSGTFTTGYIEITIDHSSSTTAVGVTDLTSNGLDDPNFVSWQQNGDISINGTIVNTIASYGDGDVLSMAIDGPTQLTWFAKNGVWDGDPVAATGGYLLPGGSVLFVSLGSGTAGDQMTITPGPPFAFTVPSGFEPIIGSTDSHPSSGYTPGFASATDGDQVSLPLVYNFAAPSSFVPLAGAGTLSLPEQFVTEPTRIGTDLWSMVSSGGAHTLAIQRDGSLWTWGNNAAGECGLGRFLPVIYPTPVATIFGTIIQDSGLSNAGNAEVILAGFNELAPFVARWVNPPFAEAVFSIVSGVDPKGYAEIVLTHVSSTTLVAVSDTSAVDFTTPNAITWAADGTVQVNGSTVATISGYVSGDTAMIAFDEGATLVWFGINGVWHGNPATGTGGFTVPLTAAHSYMPAVSSASDGDTITLTFRDYAFPIPRGFVAINGGTADGEPLPDNTKWKYCCASQATSYAIRDDGALFAWGDNSGFQCGVGQKDFDTTAISLAVSVAGIGIVDVYTVPGHGIPVGATYEANFWQTTQRRAFYPQSGDFFSPPLGVPPIDNGSPIPALFVSDQLSNVFGALPLALQPVALDSDTFYINGASLLTSNLDPQSFAFAPRSVFLPTRIGTATDWEMIDCGPYAACGIKTNSAIWGWGSNVDGVDTSDNLQNGTIGANCNPAVGLASAPVLACNRTPGFLNEPAEPAVGYGWQSFACGFHATYLIGPAVETVAGNLWGAGESNFFLPRTIIYPRLVIPSTFPPVFGPSWTSVNITTLQNLGVLFWDYTFTRIFPGYIAIAPDGTMWSWGSNDLSQLGYDLAQTGSLMPLPKQIGTDSDWAWGETDNFPTTENQAFPTFGTRFGGPGLFNSIGFALKRNGELFTWGAAQQPFQARPSLLGRESDQLFTNVTTPTRVGTELWKSVAVNIADFNSAPSNAPGAFAGIQVDGSLWCWGYGAQCPVATSVIHSWIGDLAFTPFHQWFNSTGFVTKIIAIQTAVLVFTAFTTDTLTIVGHGLETGYGPWLPHSNYFLVGLDFGRPVNMVGGFVIKVDADHIKFAPTKADAFANNFITGYAAQSGVPGGTTYSITTGTAPSYPLKYSDGVNNVDDTFYKDVPFTPIATGDGPFRLLTNGRMPTPLAANTDYWAIVDNTAHTFKMASSQANALAGTAIALSDSGAGATFAVPPYWVANNAPNIPSGGGPCYIGSVQTTFSGLSDLYVYRRSARLFGFAANSSDAAAGTVLPVADPSFIANASNFTATAGSMLPNTEEFAPDFLLRFGTDNSLFQIFSTATHLAEPHGFSTGEGLYVGGGHYYNGGYIHVVDDYNFQFASSQADALAGINLDGTADLGSDQATSDNANERGGSLAWLYEPTPVNAGNNWLKVVSATSGFAALKGDGTIACWLGNDPFPTRLGPPRGERLIKQEIHTIPATAPYFIKVAHADAWADDYGIQYVAGGGSSLVHGFGGILNGSYLTPADPPPASANAPTGTNIQIATEGYILGGTNTNLLPPLGETIHVNHQSTYVANISVERLDVAIGGSRAISYTIDPLTHAYHFLHSDIGVAVQIKYYYRQNNPVANVPRPEHAYWFSSADHGKQVKISYTYNDPTFYWVDVHGTPTNVFAVASDGTLWVWAKAFSGTVPASGVTDSFGFFNNDIQEGYIISVLGFDLHAAYGTLPQGSSNTTTLPDANYSHGGYPFQVGTDTDWIGCKIAGAISRPNTSGIGGSNTAGHTVAVKASGNALVWGTNDFGQLGLGDTTTRATPTPVGGGFIDCAAMSATIMLLKDTTGAQAFVTPEHVFAVDPTDLHLRSNPVTLLGSTPETIAVDTAALSLTPFDMTAGTGTTPETFSVTPSTLTLTSHTVTLTATSALIPTPVLGLYYSYGFSANDITVADLLAANTPYNVLYHVQAFSVNGDANLSIQGVPPNYATDLVAWKNSGRLALLMIANGTVAAGQGNATFLSPTNVAQATASLITLIDAFGFQGIDWDLENDSLWNTSTIASIEANLRSHYGASFVLSMVPRPFELRSGGLKRAIAPNYDIIGLQYYDFDLTTMTSIINPDLADFTTNLPAIAASSLILGFSPESSSNPTAAQDASLWVSGVTAFSALRGAFFWQSGEATRDSWATTMHAASPPA